ncbi:radical SAM protein [Streptomyces sp. NPDC091027]|uniref:radical SAM protein n=1 Tax=Streptomyces sp. NPDC091027 TaxID=3365971 RepID=UPI00381AE733
MLDLQLHYRCDAACRLCSHGTQLHHADAFTPEQAVHLLTLMREQYGTEAVTLLGGEPFVYNELTHVVRYAKQYLGLSTEIRTTGFQAARRLAEIAPHIDLLRISLAGDASAAGRARRAEGDQRALRALGCAGELGIRTAVTVMVSPRNISGIPLLARKVEDLGACQLTLDWLWPLGHAANHPGLMSARSALYSDLYDQLRAAGLGMQVSGGEDLPGEVGPGTGNSSGGQAEVTRTEVDPRGALTMFHEGAGEDPRALWYDKTLGRIVCRPGDAQAFDVKMGR